MGKRTCTASDCDNPATRKCQGWCEKHYYRWYRTGSIEDPRPTAEQRFFDHIAKAQIGCWPWNTADRRGYGAKFYADGAYHSPHRWSYQHFVGPIPEGMTVDHRCHDEQSGCVGGPTCQHRRCVNPAHLMPATGPANTSRGVKSWQTHCKRGHEFTEANIRWYRGRRCCRACNAERHRTRRKRYSGS